MATQKHDLKNILKRPMTTKEAASLWADDFNSIFKPDKRRLTSWHEVPKVERSYAENW